MKLNIKRIYEPVEPGDGVRILVDRLWPRGIKKEKAAIDFWIREIGPSTTLRVWFNHDPEKWAAFRKLYLKELKNSPAVTELVLHIKGKKHVTLLYSARDEVHNQAVVIKEFVEKLRSKK